MRYKTRFYNPKSLNVSSRAFHRVIRVNRQSSIYPSQRTYNLTISDQYQFIWFRVAKVATRSILSELKRQAGCLEVEHVYDKLYPVNTYRDYFKFGFVRNPWDRLVSCWKNKIVDAGAPTEKDVTRWRRLSESITSFADFVDYVADLDVSTCDMHLRLQSHLLNLSDIDYVGRFETLERDMASVFKRCGLRVPTLPHRNRSSGKSPYQDYYDKNLRDRVAGIYKKDIQIFGYRFE